jgi:thiol-disulfide isomerase/thioredoxin
MKINKKTLVFVGLCLALTITTTSQEKKAFRIKDQFETSHLIQVLEKKYGNTIKKALKGKAILIDFWNVWCNSCWKGMPKMEALQKRFENELVIVEVTANSNKQVNEAYQKLGKVPPKIYSITDDEVLSAQFPHLGDPLHVWIDKKGIIRYITNGHNATEQNIKDFLEGKPLVFSVRGNLGFSGKVNTLLENAANHLQRAITSYSLFVKGTHEYAGLLPSVSSKERIKPSLSFHQQPLLNLYWLAYFKELYGFEKPKTLEKVDLIFFEVRDSTPFIRQTDSNSIDRWNESYLYSYESFYPDADQKMLSQILKEDLKRQFPFTVSIETRTLPCITFSWICEPGMTKSFNGGDKADDKLNPEATSFEEILKKIIISNQNKGVRFVSDIPLQHHVKLNLKANLQDLDALEKELRQYGIEMSSALRNINVLVIKDKTDNN